MSEIELHLDPDEVIRANHTPVFKPIKPKYTPEDTPPPLVLEDAPDRPWRTRPSPCDALLIRELDPNRLDIAAYAGEHALDSGSQSDAEDQGSEGDHESDLGLESLVGVRNRDFTASPSAAWAMAMTASEALRIEAIHDIEIPDRPKSSREGEKVGHEASEQSQQDSGPITVITEPRCLLPKGKLDLKPPPRLLLVSASATSRRGIADEGDSIATSPTLAKYVFTQGNLDNVLPKIQSSPRKSTSAHSLAVDTQTLPSLKTALSDFSGMSHYSAANGNSSSMAGPSLDQHIRGYGSSAAPYTHFSPSTNGMSPSSLPTHRSSRSWPQTSVRGSSHSATNSPEYTSTHSKSQPSSATTNPSLADSIASPISAYQSHDDDSIGTPHVNGTGAPTINGKDAPKSFKCTYSGCTAVPFQTQYLLNSHKNFHSSSRPHFCPVAGCSRGPGGNGFKRKNEMFRLVHRSPGYQCPFCPDQTRKYPRPDNLQRHVRVHHKEKDRDDPLLRQVLAQRLDGSIRGRRRKVSCEVAGI